MTLVVITCLGWLYGKYRLVIIKIGYIIRLTPTPTQTPYVRKNTAMFVVKAVVNNPKLVMITPRKTVGLEPNRSSAIFTRGENKNASKFAVVATIPNK